jgi:hypothetical protein
MPDDLTARYEHLSHRELYAALMRGSPTQVADLSAIWKSMESTMGGLADSLRADLNRLLHGWDSAAGREFDRRVGLIATYSHVLADEFTAIHSGLTVMAGALSDAQREAEHPDAHDHPHAHLAHAAPLSILGVLNLAFEGVVGSGLGHQADQAEQDRARSRMLAVVCALAAEYRVTDYGTWPPRVPPPPKDTPARRPELVATAQVAQPVQPQVATTHVKPHHYVDQTLAAAPAPGVITAHSKEDNWPGTGAAVTGAVVAAGGIVVAATAHRGRKNQGMSDLALESVDDSGVVGDDGVIRSSQGSMHGSLSLHGVVATDGIDMTTTTDTGTATGHHGLGGHSVTMGHLGTDNIGIVEIAGTDAPGGHGVHLGHDLHGIDLGHGGVDVSHTVDTTSTSFTPGSELASGGQNAGPAGTTDGSNGPGADGRSMNTVPPGAAPGPLGTPGAAGSLTGGPGASSVPGGTGPSTMPSSGPTSTGPAGAGPNSVTGTTSLAAGPAASGPTGIGADLGGAGGLDDRSWQSDGKPIWGDTVDDPTPLTHPEAPSTEDTP